MAMPALSYVGTRLYEAIDPLVRGQDAAQDYVAAKFTAARAAMFEQVAELVRDRDDMQGWAILFDPQQCPADLLPWLAQYEGVEIPPSVVDEQEIRDLIDETPSQQRGTIWSITALARRYLTGTRAVWFYERYLGDPDVLAIRTRTAETPDPDLLLSSIVKFQKPGGVILDYAAVAGLTYDEAEALWATYTIAEAASATYQDAEEA